MSDEIRYYRDLYTSNNNHIQTLLHMQEIILEKINTLSSERGVSSSSSGNPNIYIYSTIGGVVGSSVAGDSSRESDITNTTFGNCLNPVNSECSISMETFTNESNVSRINLCGHIFNREGLNQWLETNNTCPTCRQRVYVPRSRMRRRSLVSSLAEHFISSFSNFDSSENIIDLSFDFL